MESNYSTCAIAIWENEDDEGKKRNSLGFCFANCWLYSLEQKHTDNPSP